MAVSLTAESWVWWSCVLLVIVSRFISRRMALHSWKNYQADEYIMLVAFCFYTVMTATIRIVFFTSSNLLPPGFDIASLTESDIHKREYGSKLILVVEQCQIMTIWLAKACLIIMYLRLTTLRKENIAIKVLAVYIAIGFVVMEILYFGVWCQPFHNYWAVPTPNKQCDAATNHLITNAVFNLTSDVAMLAIGLPMFLRMKMHWRKKIPIIGIFSLGVFVIVAAVLNKIYSFTQPFGSKWTYWYVRESSTALIVANLPFVWTLWRRVMYPHASKDSRQNSVVTGSISGRSRPKMNRHDSSMNGLKTGRSSSEDDLEDLEMDGPLSKVRSHTSNHMSFAEMLRADGEGYEQSGSRTDDPNVSPLTHPHLFYGKSRSKSHSSEAPRSRVEQAVLKDSFERPTWRRESTADVSAFLDTPGSSTFAPESFGQKSTGSFV